MVSPPAVINGHLTSEAPKKTRKEINGEESIDVDFHEPRLPLAKSPSSVDGDGDVSMGIRAAEEAHDQEPPPALTLTNGPSVGVQVTPAKAADLSPDTAIFPVAPPPYHVTHTLWRPGDPTVVAVAGDNFCGIWKFSPSSPPVEEKLVEDGSDRALVTAISWDPTGQKFAVGTYTDLCGTVSVYNVHGYALDLLPEMSRIITGIHWTPNDSRLVLVASSNTLTELAVWNDFAEIAPPQVLDSIVYDFTWSGHNRAYVCGDGAVYQCDVDSGIHVSQTFPSASPSTPWTYVRSAKLGDSPVAVAASSAIAALWVPTHGIRLDDAHHGDITAIELHTQAQTWGPSPKQSIILASFSTDDTVKIWHVNLEATRFDCIHRLFLGPSMPALGGGFSPDGYAVAAVSKNGIFIWNTERGNAMATWTRPGSEKVKAEEGADGVNGQNGMVDAPDRALSWDTDGKRLAVGLAEEVCLCSLWYDGC